MTNFGHGITGLIITSLSLIHGLIAVIVSSSTIGILIYHWYNHRLKQEEKTNIVLFANIYFVMFIAGTIIVSLNIRTLIGDVFGINFESSWCIFEAYCIAVLFYVWSYGFVIQAFYRLCRIVYSNIRWLQLFRFYIVSLPIQIILASIILSPLLILHDVTYLPNEHYCFISFTNTRGMIYVAFICYVIPSIKLGSIYIRIIVFIRQQPINIALELKQRQKRDLIAIQRILINVGLLAFLGFPTMVFTIMSLINGINYPLGYRIGLIATEISLAILSIEMIFTTPQIKKIVFKREQQIRVITIEGLTQMRHFIGVRSVQ